MRCREVSGLLVAYLDGEVTPSERTLVETHLAGCYACQEELATLSALRRRVGRSLCIRAARAAPSPQAWSHLQARLAEEALPLPRRLPARAERLASGVRQFACQIREGGTTMKFKRFALSGVVVAVLVTGLFAFVSTGIGPGTSTAYAKEIAQESYQSVLNWTPQQQEAAKRAFGADPRTILEEALNARDLQVLTYDDLVSQSPNAGAPAPDKNDSRDLKYLQFTKDGAKVVVGIDPTNNLPVFVGRSDNWSVIAH